MRVLRIELSGETHYSALAGDAMLRLFDAAPWAGGTLTERRVASSAARTLAPVAPSKIVCVGRNYAAHAKELGNAVPSEPLLFLKPPSSLCAHGEPITLPAMSERVEHEAELGVVIGRRLKRASPESALEAVYGVTCVNDVTARDLQKKDVQFTRAKGFDSFCPVGPWIETEPSQLDAIEVIARVNGQVRQHGNTRDMLFSVGTLLSFISHVMTLEPGDLIATGTPEGVGPLVAGDRVEIEIGGVGVLANPVG